MSITTAIEPSLLGRRLPPFTAERALCTPDSRGYAYPVCDHRSRQSRQKQPSHSGRATLQIEANGIPQTATSHATLDLVQLAPLLELTRGTPDVCVGLLDGSVAVNHPHLTAARVRGVSATSATVCDDAASTACRHGTLVAGVLVAERDSGAPAICPGCTLLVRPIFLESRAAAGDAISASLDEVTAAIVEAIAAGASILNLSSALAGPSTRSERGLHDALDFAASRGVIVVAAAGNQATLGSSAITRHPWVIPVIACDRTGRPATSSNLSHSAAKRGLAAPGEGVTSLGPDGTLQDFAGTSAATPFVTGTVALLKSLFPDATGGELRDAVTRVGARRRTTVVPPLLAAFEAYRWLAASRAQLTS